MITVQFEMEVPKNCMDCPMCGYPKPTPTSVRHYKVCLIDDGTVATTRRPKHCPLREINVPLYPTGKGTKKLYKHWVLKNADTGEILTVKRTVQECYNSWRNMDIYGKAVPIQVYPIYENIERK